MDMNILQRMRSEFQIPCLCYCRYFKQFGIAACPTAVGLNNVRRLIQNEISHSKFGVLVLSSGERDVRASSKPCQPWNVIGEHRLLKKHDVILAYVVCKLNTSRRVPTIICIKQQCDSGSNCFPHFSNTLDIPPGFAAPFHTNLKFDHAVSLPHHRLHFIDELL